MDNPPDLQHGPKPEPATDPFSWWRPYYPIPPYANPWR